MINDKQIGEKGVEKGIGVIMAMFVPFVVNSQTKFGQLVHEQTVVIIPTDAS